MDKRIPVTILTGFLGAGKTTILNTILKQYNSVGIRIVENEFGSENIDSSLVESKNEILEISNGCICCSSSDEFVTSLFQLRDSEVLPEHVIIETTGIANPETLIRQFLSDYSVSAAFRLNAVITVADVLHLDGLLLQRPEVEPQLRSANIIALSKCDLADSYQLDTARNICKRINPEAKILELHNGIPTSETSWLEMNDYQPSGIAEYTLKAEKEKNIQWHGSLKKMVVEMHEPLDILKFDTWIKTILRFPHFKIYRLKGYLFFEDIADKLVVQAVQEIYQTSSIGKWKIDETKKSVLVIIGEGIDEERIKKSFHLSAFNAEYIDFSEYCSLLEKSLLSESE